MSDAQTYELKLINISRDRRCLSCGEMILQGERGAIVMCGNFARAIHAHCVPRYLERKKERDEQKALRGGNAGPAANGRVIKKGTMFS